jgi:hypothetical protein
MFYEGDQGVKFFYKGAPDIIGAKSSYILSLINIGINA